MKTKKAFLIIALLLITFTVSAKDDPLLDFINGLFTGKIPYTTESFVKQGFVSVKSLTKNFEKYETTWNNQFVVIETNPTLKMTLIKFSQTPSLDPTRIEQTYKEIKPDREKYLKDWQTFFNYFSKKHKIVSSKENKYYFKNFKILNTPSLNQFIIMDYQLDR